MVGLAKISTGKIEPSTQGKDVPKEEWEFLLSARRSYCNHQFQYDCKELLFFIDDGRANNFFDYQDEVTYWREGLCLEPEAVPFAENYLRTRKARLEAGIDGRDWRDISFGEAVTLGKEQGGAPIGNKNASKNNHDNIKVVSKRFGGYGTSRAYILARLDRDGYTELATRVRADEMSANAAAIEAGFRKKLSPFEQILKLLAKLSADDRNQLLAILSERRHVA